MHPMTNKKYHKRERNQAYTCQHKINIHAMMSAFFIDTGGLDIGYLMAMFGVLDGRGWERQFSRHSPWMNKIIIELASKIMKKKVVIRD